MRAAAKEAKSGAKIAARTSRAAALAVRQQPKRTARLPPRLKLGGAERVGVRLPSYEIHRMQPGVVRFRPNWRPNTNELSILGAGEITLRLHLFQTEMPCIVKAKVAPQKSNDAFSFRAIIIRYAQNHKHSVKGRRSLQPHLVVVVVGYSDAGLHARMPLVV